MGTDLQARIGARTAAIRDAIGMTQEGLAAALGVDKSNVGQIESGRRNLTTGSVERLCEHLGVSLATFFDDDMFREIPGGGVARTLPPRSNADEALLDLMRATPSVSAAEAARRLGCSRSTIDRAVARLKAEGRLRREGNNRSGRWVVVEGDEGDGNAGD